MKKILTILVLLSVPSVWASADSLRVGVQDASPPFGFLGDDGELTGFDVDMARAVCEEISASCDLVPSDFAGLIPGLIDGSFDMVVASVSITEQRRELVDFTQKYYASPARFVVRRGSGLAVSHEGIEEGLVGVKRGTTFENYLRDNQAGSTQILSYGTNDEALLDLVLGRLNAVLGDRIILQESFLNTPVGANFTFAGPSLDDRRWFGDGAGIAVQKNRTELLDRLNSAIAAIRDDERYESIRDDYFSYDIYGGPPQ